VPFVSDREIVVLLVFVFVLGVHETVAFVHHMLLATSRVAEHLAAEETKVTQLDTLSYVGKEALQASDAVDIENVERVN